MATTININCTDQVLAITNSPSIASGGFNEDNVKFTFCNKWVGFARTAVFYRDTDHVYHVVLDEFDECTIPHEVLADSGVVYIGVFGVDSEDTIRTSNILTYRVCKGAITTATEVTDPTPDIYAQILASYADVTAKAKFFYECTDAEIDDVFDGDYVPESMDDPTTRQTVETEVTDARGEYTDLEARLDDSDDILALKVPKADIVDNLTTDDATKVLSAKQGKVLKDAQDTHENDADNPHSVTKSQVGLGNVDNTSDANKPVSTPQQIALNTKVDKVEGKGLSTNDYTTQEKEKLEDIETGAEVNPDIVDNITTNDATKTLSAKQGKVLNDRKANIDGSYDQFEAGTAKNLTGKGDSIPANFTYRPSSDTDSIVDGAATIVKLKGNTIVWNQYVKNGNFVDTTTWASTSSNLSVSSNVLTATVTAEATTYYGHRITTTAVAIKSNHKYFVQTYILSAKALKVGIGLGSVSSIPSSILTLTPNTWGKTTAIWTSPADYTETFAICFDQNMIMSVNDTCQIKNVMCIDLTQMFGSGNEPATVAEFEALFPKNYYAYDTGSLLSFNATGVKTVGFNLVDDETVLVENGLTKVGEHEFYIANTNTTYGKKVWENKCGYTGRVYISLKAKITNTVAGSDGLRLSVKYKNGSIAYACRTSNTTAYTEFSFLSSEYFPVDYIYWDYGSGANSTWIKDLCVNFSWSGIRNGEYKAYWTQTRNLPIATYFPNGMRSAGSAYDELTKEKAITRIGAVDMGSLTWAGIGMPSIFYTNVPTKSFGGTNLQCANYNVNFDALASISDKSIRGETTTTIIYVKDTSYTSGAEFKTAMSGVMLYYELATPTEVTIDPVLNLGYQVADFGTEEIISDATTEPKTAPCKFDTVYGLNYPDTVRNLDVNYTNVDTLDALLAVLGTACNGTLTRSPFDEVNRKYTFTFTPNA